MTVTPAETVHHDEQPILSLVEELQRGDIPARFKGGDGVPYCELMIKTPEDQLWIWVVVLVNESGWGFDVYVDDDWILTTTFTSPGQLTTGSCSRLSHPCSQDSSREVAAWIMGAITDMHGERPAFVREGGHRT